MSWWSFVAGFAAGLVVFALVAAAVTYRIGRQLRRETHAGSVVGGIPMKRGQL